LHEIYWIKSKPDKSIMKLGPVVYVPFQTVFMADI